MINKKSLLIFLAAVVTPGGFIMFGVYKAYGYYKKRQIAKAKEPKNFEEYMEQLRKDAEENPE